MKKSLYDHHYEKVIDKPYNERIKVKSVKPVYPILMSVIPWIVSLVHWLEHDDTSGVLMFMLMYFVFMSNTLILNVFKEAWANKRFYVYTIMTSMIFIATTVILGISYFKNMTDISMSMIILLSAIIIIPILLYIIISCLLTKKTETSECTTLVQATCVGYDSKEVPRFVSNGYRQRRDRQLSPAYGDSETVIVHTPIFQFEWNNTVINAKPNMSINEQAYAIGTVYDVYINPNNPSEIRLK